MRFDVDIDRMTDDRPEGRIRDERTGTESSFTGWVELLRLMEHHCVIGAGEDPAGPRSTERSA